MIWMWKALACESCEEPFFLSYTLTSSHLSCIDGGLVFRSRCLREPCSMAAERTLLTVPKQDFLIRAFDFLCTRCADFNETQWNECDQDIRENLRVSSIFDDILPSSCNSNSYAFRKVNYVTRMVLESGWIRLHYFNKSVLF